MEVNFPALNAKKQKLSEQCNLDEEENRIDNLPEGILLHILSFLSTKDSVKTSILSKRWQCLWMSVPNLNFEDGRENKRNLSMNFVEGVLMLRDPSNIQKFSLSCSVFLDDSRINAWIFAAVRHKVRELYLCLNFVYEPSFLLYSIFTCGSLEVLELDMFHDLMLPYVICFSSLKIMTLRNVTFWDHHSPGRLFSGCPVLEKLTLDECDWENIKSVCISAPMLRSLAIFESPGDECNCEVVISGTSLNLFNYGGELRNDYCFCNSSSLVNACIDVYKREDIEEQGIQREVAERTHKLLRGLYNATELILANATFEVLNYTEELLAQLPIFSNLTFLKLTMGSVNFACGALMKLLQNSPSLNTMQCVEGISLNPYGEKDDWILDPVPQCFSENFRTIEIWDFRGTQREVDVIKNLLKTATALDNMCLMLVGSLHEQYEYLKQLEVLPSERLECICIHDDP